ncbi:MAG: hypothetical protein ABSC94_17100 [Polyangiaceae bacterium]|jgi:hypothetical protein
MQPTELLELPPELAALELEETEGVDAEIEEPVLSEPEVVTPELSEPEPELAAPVEEELELVIGEIDVPELLLVVPPPVVPPPPLVILAPVLDFDAPPGLVPHPCEATAMKVHKATVDKTPCMRARDPRARVQRASSCPCRASVVIGLRMLV